MSSIVVSQRNQREFLFYLLGGTMVLFLLLMTALAVWYARPIIPPTKIVVGNVADFPPSDEPYFAGTEPYIILTNIEGQIYIFEPYLPYEGKRCRLLWRSDEGFFEDPCWAFARFGLDGEIVRTYLPSMRPMDRYAYEIDENGQIIMDISQIIEGQVAGELIGLD